MSCHPGELKRGDLPALVLATAHAQTQTEAELHAAVCAAGGVRYSPERHNRVVRQLILLGYLHPDHLTVTTAGRAELARQRTPLRRGTKPKARVATLNAVVLEPLAAYGPLTTHEIARQLAVTPQRAAAFLTYVTSAGQAQTVTRTDASGHAAQAWEITPAGHAYLARDKATGVAA